MNLEDYIGKKFSRFTIVEVSIGKHGKMAHWKCDCGKSGKTQLRSILHGKSRSCGCLKKEIFTKHGLSHTITLTSWRSMVSRCTCVRHHNYKNYGGRGIKICNNLRSSVGNLASLIGERPRGMTLDRIENDFNYSCGRCKECRLNKWTLNVKWSTPKEQLRNTRCNKVIEFNGESKCVAQWGEDTGINPATILSRIIRGVPTHKLFLPARKYKQK